MSSLNSVICPELLSSLNSPKSLILSWLEFLMWCLFSHFLSWELLLIIKSNWSLLQQTSSNCMKEITHLSRAGSYPYQGALFVTGVSYLWYSKENAVHQMLDPWLRSAVFDFHQYSWLYHSNGTVSYSYCIFSQYSVIAMPVEVSWWAFTSVP